MRSELFRNLNDQDVVKKRLAEIETINERAASLQKQKVNTLRSEFGKQPVDFSGYEKQPTSVRDAQGGMPSMDAIEAEIARRRGAK